MHKNLLLTQRDQTAVWEVAIAQLNKIVAYPVVELCRQNLRLGLHLLGGLFDRRAGRDFVI